MSTPVPVKGLEYLVGTSREKCGNPDEERQLRRDDAVQSTNHRENDGRTGTGSSWKDGCRELASSHHEDNRPRNDIFQFTSLEMSLDQNENEPPRDKSAGNRDAGLRKFDPQFVHRQAANDRDNEGDEDFEIELKGEWIPPVHHHLEPLFKKREDGQHGAALDHDIKKIALAVIQPLLKNEQMPGG